MNNLLSYCGLVDTRISDSEKHLPVSNGCSFCELILFIMAENNKKEKISCAPKGNWMNGQFRET